MKLVKMRVSGFDGTKAVAPDEQVWVDEDFAKRGYLKGYLAILDHDAELDDEGNLPELSVQEAVSRLRVTRDDVDRVVTAHDSIRVAVAEQSKEP